MSKFPSRLLQGYDNFVNGRLTVEADRYAHLATEGQSPKVMVIGCCDSRCSPEVIFDAGPGELFVVRNVANLVPPYKKGENDSNDFHGTSAALEFAVMALRVEHIVVMGHARCGGIRAAASEDKTPLSPGDFINKWISLVEPASEKIGKPKGELTEDYLRKLEHASVANGLQNLRTFPCVNILEGRGKIQLHGAFFDISTGILSVLDKDTGEFVPASAQGRKAFGCFAAE